MNSTTFVLFGKYCPIVNQLGSKDSSRDFQLNCVISYFLPIFTISCMGLKIDVTERVKKFQLLGASKQGAGMEHPSCTRRAGRRGGGRAVLLPLPRAYQARGTSAVQSPEVSARAQGAIMDFSRC
jgi:hypothetical protein